MANLPISGAVSFRVDPENRGGFWLVASSRGEPVSGAA